MTTTIEISSSAIRLCREQERKLTTLESWPVPAGADPLAALAALPLPGNLGRVRVALHHDDMLLRVMVQPPCPRDRLDRLVRFELSNAAGDQDQPVDVSWHLAEAIPGDMRVLALVTKTRLVTQLRQALTAHGGRLAALTHPSLGIYHAFKAQEITEPGPFVLVDVGGASVHVAMVQDGGLVFARSQSPGMRDAISAIAGLRGVSEPDAAKLAARLGKNAPDDLKEIIMKHAGALAALITANVRFAKNQLALADFAPKAIYLAGGGAQLHGVAETVAARTGLPVRLLNPFAGMTAALPADTVDRHAQLPSPWTVLLGVAQAKTLELDALADDRKRQARFWQTDGALKIAAVAAVALLTLALAVQEARLVSTNAAGARLTESPEQLVPKADDAIAQLAKLQQSKAIAAGKLAWLDSERRPGRVTTELLNAISQEQDPVACPVVLQAYRVSRLPGRVQVELEGFAQTAGKASTADVLHRFEERLRARYPLISTMEQLPRPIDSQRQTFAYRIAILDSAR